MRDDLRAEVAIFALALVLRVAFVAWAPGIPTGDGIFYGQHAEAIVGGMGYANLDGSPAIQWMPGWPLVIAALYFVFGVEPVAAMLANALFGALTAWVVIRIGRTLGARRPALIAGVLVAVWPGLIYFTATLFSETLFTLLLVGLLYCLLQIAPDGRVQRRWVALSGSCLGAAALVKAEPLALTPVLLAYLWMVSPSRREAAFAAATLFAVAGLFLMPWIVRNALQFGRLIPTSAGGGMIVHLGNHAGASGGNDLNEAVRYRARFGDDLDLAESALAMNEAGWRDALAFALANPREEAAIMLNKLKLTYQGDWEGAHLVRGFFGRDNWHLSDRTWQSLVLVADVYFHMMIPLMLGGLRRFLGWPLSSRVLLLGVVATWFGLHLVFLGGMRFHIPETPIYALIAAGGIEIVAEALTGRRETADGVDVG